MQILLILLNTVIPGSNFEATMSMAGYAKDAACMQTFGPDFGNRAHGQNSR